MCEGYNKGVCEMKKKIVAGILVAAVVSTIAVTATTGVKGLVSNASYSVEQALNTEVSTKANYTEDTQLVKSYQNVLAEEKYVSELVSQKLGKEVTTKDWEVCLEYLENNLDALLLDETIEKDKVNNYVETYRIIKSDNELEASGMEATGVNPGLNNYDVSKVSEYISNYWDYDSYNPEYPDFNPWGGDCANFVSQCLHAGGMQMVGTDASNFNNWFCRTSITEQFSKTSSTWRGAAAFASYWKKNSISYYDFGPEYFENRQSFKEVFKYANVGDAISFIIDNGRPYHTTIVAHKDRDGDREIRFAAHTSSQFEKSLYSYASGGYIEAVRIYKMSTPSAELEASYNYDSYDEDVDSLYPENDWYYDYESDYEYIYNDTTNLNGDYVYNETTDDDFVDGWYTSDGRFFENYEDFQASIQGGASDNSVVEGQNESDLSIDENQNANNIGWRSLLDSFIRSF